MFHVYADVDDLLAKFSSFLESLFVHFSSSDYYYYLK